MNNTYSLKKVLVWGFILWLIGYILGIILFPFVPNPFIGWFIMPIGILTTLWVLLKKIKGNSLKDYIKISAMWTGIAILFDYFFLVKVFDPVDGYYKFDVYLYYVITFIIPLFVGLNREYKFFR
jgi:hypothetical protein